MPHVSVKNSGLYDECAARLSRLLVRVTAACALSALRRVRRYNLAWCLLMPVGIE